MDDDQQARVALVRDLPILSLARGTSHDPAPASAPSPASAPLSLRARALLPLIAAQPGETAETRLAMIELLMGHAHAIYETKGPLLAVGPDGPVPPCPAATASSPSEPGPPLHLRPRRSEFRPRRPFGLPLCAVHI